MLGGGDRLGIDRVWDMGINNEITQSFTQNYLENRNVIYCDGGH